ncbi:MAG TPA: hypothetical protein VE445_04640, partial [Nitrososphaeraceae archaeon]|nr:hypothetical protein [Nitrososphaeraceae archaeon]
HPNIISASLVPSVVIILPIEQAASITLYLNDSVSGISDDKRNNAIQIDAILVGNPLSYIYIYNVNSLQLIIHMNKYLEQ